jgi:hypothetical protein
VLSNDHLYGIMDSAQSVMGPSIPRNFERWPVLGVYIWPNYYVGQSYDDEVGYLRSWIDERLVWMDQKWGGQCWPLSQGDLPVIPPPSSGSIYPNPSDLSSTFVNLGSEGERELPFRLIDMSGRVVHQGLARYSGHEFAYALPDLSYLPGGIYTLVIGKSDSVHEVYKLVKK